MRNKVLYKCDHCGHIELEHKTWKTRLKKIPKYFMFATITLFTFLGVLGAYNLISFGVFDRPDLMFQPSGGLIGFLAKYNVEQITDDQVKNFSEYVEPIIKGCEDEECEAKKIFDHLTTFNYDEGTDWIPEDILSEKEGDCDEMSLLYMYLLKSININSGMKCTINHCWTIVITEDKKIEADVVNNIWRER